MESATDSATAMITAATAAAAGGNSTRCRKCGARMGALEVVSDFDAIARILQGACAPPVPPPGQLLLLP